MNIYYKNRVFTQSEFELSFNSVDVDRLRDKGLFVKNFRKLEEYTANNELVFNQSQEGGYLSNYCKFDKKANYGSIRLFNKSISLNEVRFMALERRGNTETYALHSIDFYNQNIKIGLKQDFKNAIKLTFLNGKDTNVIVHSIGEKYAVQRIYDDAMRALIQDCKDNRELINAILNTIKSVNSFNELKTGLLLVNALGSLESEDYYGN